MSAMMLIKEIQIGKTTTLDYDFPGISLRKGREKINFIFLLPLRSMEVYK